MADNLTTAQIIDEDEIDLKELFSTIWKYKYKIVFFVILVTSCVLLYVLSLPNWYKSEVILAPQNSQKSSAGGLASLASLAGVSIGGGASSKDPFVMMNTTLKDYTFNKKIIMQYDLNQKLENPKNLVFALGIDAMYNLKNAKKPKDEEDTRSEEDKIYSSFKTLSNMLMLSSDKKSGLITLSASSVDRVFAKELVDIYLKEMIKKIQLQDMKEIDKQILYYKKELSMTYDVSLKEQLSKSLSALMQKRVFSLANDYYFVSKLSDSRVSYIKEKTKPKRALILIVGCVTSFILAIFMIFFIEFLRNDKKE